MYSRIRTGGDTIQATRLFFLFSGLDHDDCGNDCHVMWPMKVVHGAKIQMALSENVAALSDHTGLPAAETEEFDIEQGKANKQDGLL